MEIKLFVFDMGDVVILEGFVWKELFGKYNINVNNIREIGPESKKAIELMLKKDISEEELWSAVSKDLGYKFGQVGLLYKYYRCLEIDGTRAIINELIAKGHRVVCGTNNIKPFYQRIKEGGYYDIFPKVYSSFKIGISKPDPEYWRYIAKEEGVELNEMFFTDDNKTNIAAAASLGIKTHLFTEASGLRAKLEELGAL